jgi:hypothetical protein
MSGQLTAYEAEVWKKAYEREHATLCANYQQQVRVTEAIVVALELLSDASLEKNDAAQEARKFLKKVLAP